MARIHAAEMIRNSSFRRFHWSLLLWSFIVILFDGYDLVVYGTIVPHLMEDWSLSSVEAGTIGSLGLLGVMAGAFLFGPAADRFGRKKVILACVLVFSLFTALCGFAGGPLLFSVFRILAGLGLGGVMPNVIALNTDYAPKKMRSITVSAVLCGYSLGGVIAPLLSIRMSPVFGWQSVYWITALPIVLLPWLSRCLPESPAFLLEKGRTAELGRYLKRIEPSVAFGKGDEWVREIAAARDTEPSSPVRKLFRGGRGLSTAMIWLTYFMSLLMVYGLNTWLPNLMMKAGYALGSSLTFLVVLNGGAIIGTLVLGKLADRYGGRKMLIPMFLVGAVCLTLLGFKSHIAVLYILATITGICTIGAQHIANAYVSHYYPPHARSTALGFASGVGRIGAIIGPYLGGVLLTAAWPIHMNFITFAVPGLIAAAALWFVSERKAFSAGEQ